MATRKTMALLACSLALVQLVALCHAGVEQKLCLDEVVTLNSLSDLMRTSTEGCYDLAAKAFEDLKKLVFDDKNICTMEKATSITKYYNTHLKSEGTLMMPPELYRFAVAYGMKVNSQCKWYMTGEFFWKVDKTVYEEEYEAIKQWTIDDGPIARLLSPLIKQGEFLVPSDFETLVSKPERESMLELDSVDSDKLIRVKDLCNNRFRKLYDPILLMIAHLDLNGLNYKSMGLTRHLALSTEARKHNILWSRIVFLCETLRGMSDFNDAEIGPSQVKEIEDFQPKLEIEDPVVDSSVKSAVKSYERNLSELDRFKNRIISTLKSSGLSKEFMAKIIERVFNDEKDGGQDEELRADKKELLNLIDPASRDKLVQLISKMSTGGKKAGRKIASALSTSILMTMGALAVTPQMIVSDLHSLKRDFKATKRVVKKSNMKHQAFEDA